MEGCRTTRTRGADLEQRIVGPPDAAHEIERLLRVGRIEEARLALVTATQGSLYRFLVGMLRDEERAADLFQETYVKAFQGLNSFRGDASPTTWVLSIGRNLALNRIRRWTLEARWRVDMETLPEVAAGGPDDGDARSEPRLMDSVGALPLAQREAVVLFYLEDLSIDEVARLTGRPANTVKSDLRRARTALRDALADPAEPGLECP